MDDRLTASAWLGRSIESDQAKFLRNARSLADLAEQVATGPPAEGVPASGDLTRLISSASFLLGLAVKIETSLENHCLMKADSAQ